MHAFQYKEKNTDHFVCFLLQTISLDEETVCAPKIVKKLPQLMQTTEGSTTTLEVKVIGKPKPEVKWFREDEEIIPSDEYEIENKPDGTSVLIIKNIYPEDTGKISFEAHNSIGVAETVTELIVEGIFFFFSESYIFHFLFSIFFLL